MALNAHRVSKGVRFSNLLMKYQMRSNCKTQKEGSHNSYNKNLKYPHPYIWQLQNEQDLLGQVSRLRKREELKLCKFILESCNLKVSL